MTAKVPVLDHGYIQFINRMGDEESIVRAARQSTDGSFRSWEPYEGHPRGDAGFLAFLYRNEHSSPFEMCELLLEVQAPVFVFREWMRHRTFSFNELSARYAQMPNIHYVPSRERMVAQSKTNKQGSSEVLLDPELGDYLVGRFEEEQAEIYRTYEKALENGLAREVARVNTPVSRYSRMWVKGNLRNWLHFLKLRTASNAQYEIRVYAEEVARIVQQFWPRTWALFEEHTLHAKKLSRTELREYESWKTRNAT